MVSVFLQPAYMAIDQTVQEFVGNVDIFVTLTDSTDGSPSRVLPLFYNNRPGHAAETLNATWTGASGYVNTAKLHYSPCIHWRDEITCDNRLDAFCYAKGP